MLEIFLVICNSFLSSLPTILYLLSLFIIGGALISILEELAYKNVLNTQLNKDKLGDFDLQPTRMQRYFALNKMKEKK